MRKQDVEREQLRRLLKRAVLLNVRFRNQLRHTHKRSPPRGWDDGVWSEGAGWEPSADEIEDIALRKAEVDRARESVAVDVDNPNRNHVIPLDVKVPSRLNYLQLDDNPSHDNITKVYEDHAGFFE